MKLNKLLIKGGREVFAEVVREHFRTKEISYPCLMESTGTYVLFAAPRTGMVVFDRAKVYPIGYYVDCWFDEEFTISNENIIVGN